MVTFVISMKSLVPYMVSFIQYNLAFLSYIRVVFNDISTSKRQSIIEAWARYLQFFFRFFYHYVSVRKQLWSIVNLKVPTQYLTKRKLIRTLVQLVFFVVFSAYLAILRIVITALFFWIEDAKNGADLFVIVESPDILL